MNNITQQNKGEAARTRTRSKQAPAAVVEEPLLIHQLRLIADSGLPAAEVCQKAVVALVNLDDMLTRERQVNEELRARLSAINVAATDYTPSWPDHVVQKALHARAVLNLRK